jgi:hypothetical protein
MRNAYKILVRKPGRKSTLGRPRHRWEGSIRMDLMENGVGTCGLDSSGSGWGPVESFCEQY